MKNYYEYRRKRSLKIDKSSFTKSVYTSLREVVDSNRSILSTDWLKRACWHRSYSIGVSFGKPNCNFFRAIFVFLFQDTQGVSYKGSAYAHCMGKSVVRRWGHLKTLTAQSDTDTKTTIYKVSNRFFNFFNKE